MTVIIKETVLAVVGAVLISAALILVLGAPSSSLAAPATPAEIKPFYVVFFGTAGTAPRPEDNKVLRAAVADIHALGLHHITVTGHADDRGAAVKNARLSLARAKAVARALVRMGLNKSDITVSSEGSGRPLVNVNEDGARDANRRVEISAE